MSRPVFVTIEGIDRCGKTLQASLLVHKFREKGLPVQLLSTPDYQSPAGTLAASHLAGNVYLASRIEDKESPRRSASDSLAFECSLICDRYAVADKVRRYLDLGESVVCVRWWPSALLYGEDDGLDPDFIRAACSSLPAANLNILLHSNFQHVVERLDHHNRYESDRAKQARLQAEYLNLWGVESRRGRERWDVVSGDGAPEDVAELVWSTVSLFF